MKWSDLVLNLIKKLFLVLGNRITTRSCADSKCDDSMVSSLVEGVCTTCEHDLCNGSEILKNNSILGSFFIIFIGGLVSNKVL